MPELRRRRSLLRPVASPVPKLRGPVGIREAEGPDCASTARLGTPVRRSQQRRPQGLRGLEAVHAHLRRRPPHQRPDAQPNAGAGADLHEHRRRLPKTGPGQRQRGSVQHRRHLVVPPRLRVREVCGGGVGIRIQLPGSGRHGGGGGAEEVALSLREAIASGEIGPRDVADVAGIHGVGPLHRRPALPSEVGDVRWPQDLPQPLHESATPSDPVRDLARHVPRHLQELHSAEPTLVCQTLQDRVLTTLAIDAEHVDGPPLGCHHRAEQRVGVSEVDLVPNRCLLVAHMTELR
mmetsp:Transcript_147800/g.474445  ORF Transcript_147800/g.474445 Transcript_147800/m.474445 type:complete len:292 (+) Transcript_147800:360-1235(+)